MTSSPKPGEYCRIHFRIRCEAALGQDVGVCGNISILGNFDKSKYFRLYTTPESYPVWTSIEPILVPTGYVLSYRYCLLENGDFKTYEKCENRVIMPQKTDNFVEDHFVMEEMEVTRDSELDLFQEMRMLTSQSSGESKVDLTQMASGSRLIVVCYHLPVNVKRNAGNRSQPFTITWAESLIAKSSDNSICSNFDTFWMGTISVPGDTPNEEEMKYLLKILHDMNCLPIFLDAEIADKAYHGFCKLIMWPIFHNVDQMDQIHAGWKLFPPDGRTHPESPRDDLSVLDWNSDISQLEAAYHQLNGIFAKELSNWLYADDTVWVHDYHLMFLPQLIRDLARNVQVVFFLHIPFPTSQIFRSLPAATALLQSMAAADVVGFHTFDHARHFLTATKRILGIRSHTKQGGILALEVQDREVIVTVSHVSVEVKDIDQVLENPDTWSNSEGIKKVCNNRKIIVGLDVGQRLSGGVLKLAAYEKFLTDNPREVHKVVLYQKMVRSSSRQGDEVTTSVDMKEMVDRINSKFSKTLENGTYLPAIIYEEIALRSVTLADRITLWLASDVFLLTPIKEGLNLYPLEFIYAHEAKGRREGQAGPSNGIVIASEFSTCSSLLNGALKINPYYTLTVADTIHKALNMPTMETHQRRQRDLNFITSHPSSLWTKEIVSDLRYANNGTSKVTVNKSNHFVCYPDPLPSNDILKAFQEASHSQQFGVCDTCSRIFIFDYGGTLLNKERSDIYIKQSLSAISGRSPSATVLEAIRTLAKDPRNAILIMTGLTKLKLSDFLTDIPNVTIGTSNGLVYSWGANLLTYDEMDRINTSMKPHDPFIVSPLGTSSQNQSNNSLLNLTMKDINANSSRWWDSLYYNVDWEAVRDIAVPIITKFTFRTNGTCQTPRIPGIGWSYFGADPEWGEKQAGQCRLELEAGLANHDVKVVSQIQGSIEVVPRELNKGVLVKKFLNRVLAKRAGLLPGFALTMGDDEADDHMHRALYQHLVHSEPNADLARTKSFTVVVGRRPSTAQYYVNEVRDVEKLLSAFATSTFTASVHSTPVTTNRKMIHTSQKANLGFA